VIETELGREDHSSILHNYDREGLKPFDTRTTPNLTPNQIKPVVKTKKLQ
jgi:hypothetical protein